VILIKKQNKQITVQASQKTETGTNTFKSPFHLHISCLLCGLLRHLPLQDHHLRRDSLFAVHLLPPAEQESTKMSTTVDGTMSPFIQSMCNIPSSSNFHPFCLVMQGGILLMCVLPNVRLIVGSGAVVVQWRWVRWQQTEVYAIARTKWMHFFRTVSRLEQFKA